jgi:salicylate 5-hydroxylase large subunit
MDASESRRPEIASWPEQGVSRVPYWVYSDPDVFSQEMERVFCGDTWNYAALTCELAEPGSFKTNFVGNRPVILTRDQDGTLHCFVNRCAHRGVKFCRRARGKAKDFICPYHHWAYDLRGNLVGLPFRRGVKRQGGMPADFQREHHGLRKLKVCERGGVVFVSFSDDVEPLEGFLGPTMREYFDRVFNGRELKVLGYARQLIPCNWKLMFENIKDPYHASLMHVFLVTFGLFRADNPSAVKMDSTGRHSCLISMRGEQIRTAENREMDNLKEHMALLDPNLLTPVKEYEGDATVVMQTLWPNVVIQQQSNTLATRQLIPVTQNKFELSWTFFGYADDTEEMTAIRLRQANLMGPSGLVSVDDSEVLKMSQDGIENYSGADAILEMGGREVVDEDHMVTETAIRGFYRYYREIMGL